MRGMLTDSLRILDSKCVSKALSHKFDLFPVIRAILQGELSEQLTEVRCLPERFDHGSLEVIHGEVIKISAALGVRSNLALLISDQPSLSDPS